MTTATQTSPTESPPDVREFPITAALFFRMVESGVFPRENRVFLWEGRLYEKMAKTLWHGAAGAVFGMALMRRLPPGWSVWPESTLALDRISSPLPDLMVVRGADPYDFASRGRHPEPGEIGLLIEIAMTSLPRDLGGRLEAYARALIPSYWVAELPHRRLLAHSGPRVVEGRGEYAQVETIGPGQAVPLVLDGREVARIPFEELLRP